MVSERRRTDSDRSRLGIPAENDIFHQARLPQSDPSNAIVSTSQGSSWENLSSTSYSQSYSFVNTTQVEGVQERDQSLQPQALLPPIMYSQAQALSDLNVGCHYTQWSPEHSVTDDPTMLRSSPVILSDSPGPNVFTPNSSNTSDGYPGSDYRDHMSPQEPISPVPMFDATLIDPEFDSFQRPMTAEFLEVLPGDTETRTYLDPATFIPGPQPFDASVMGNMHSSQMSMASPSNRQDSIHVSIEEPSRGTKRKRIDPPNPPRKDIDKINKVREEHACILCRKLHENVSPIIDPCH